MQPVVLFAIVGVLVLAALVAALLLTRKKPAGTLLAGPGVTGPGMSGPGVTTPGVNGGAASAAPVLSPFDATFFVFACADAKPGQTFEVKLQRSVNRWFISSTSTNAADRAAAAFASMAQTSIVRGAQTLLRDALQQPGSVIDVPPSGPGTNWSRVEMQSETVASYLLIERQALGGRTRVIALPRAANSDPYQTGVQATVHAGAADIAGIFSAPSITAWQDTSAFADLGAPVQELIMKHGQLVLHVARAPGESRWSLLEPANVPAESSAVEQLLGVLRALKIPNAAPLSAELARARKFDGTGANAASFTIISRLRAGQGREQASEQSSEQRFEQTLAVGAPATAAGSTRWVVSSTQVSITEGAPNDESLPSFGGQSGSLDVQKLLDFVKTPEALVQRSPLRVPLADIGTLELSHDADALNRLSVIAPHEESKQALRLRRASNAQRGELKAQWVLPVAGEALRGTPATAQQQTLAQALTSLLTTTPSSSMLLLRDARSLEGIFEPELSSANLQPQPSADDQTLGSRPPPPTNRQPVRGVAALTVRGVGGAGALETAALGITTSGTPRVLMRVGRVLRVWDAVEGPAKELFEVLPLEIVPEG